MRQRGGEMPGPGPDPRGEIVEHWTFSTGVSDIRGVISSSPTVVDGVSDGAVWQLVSAMFTHVELWHIGFNMLALWMFGSPLEQTWGDRRFLTFYMVCLIGANLCQMLVATWILSSSGEAHPSLGASGGTFGLLLGYGMLFPNNRMIVFPIPVEIRARTLVIIYGALALLLGVTGWQPGIAHFAHLGGMLFGWLLIRYWRGQPPFGKGRRGPPNIRIVR